MGQLDYLKSFPSLVFNKVATKVDGTVTNEVILATDGEPQGNWLISIPVEESLENGDVEVVEGINVLTLMTRETYTRDIIQKLTEWDKKLQDALNKIGNTSNNISGSMNELKRWVNQELEKMRTEYQKKIEQAVTECKKYTDDKLKEVFPIGSILCTIFDNSSVVDYKKYLLLNGMTISTNSYPQLAKVVGNAYGNHAGASTFTLPHLAQESCFVGGCSDAKSPTLKDWGLPNVKGNVSGIAESNNGASDGCLYNSGGWNGMTPNKTDGGGTIVGVGMDLSKQAEYAAHVTTEFKKLQPLHYQARFFIRYN